MTGVIAAVFERFAVCGSVRGVWLWLREQGLRFPLQRHGYVSAARRSPGWTPTYHAVHTVLTHPAYAGAYTFGRTRAHRSVDADGHLRTRRRGLPPDEWEVLIIEHHAGSSTGIPSRPTRPASAAISARGAHQPGTGAVREGCALLQGLATCGVCGRKLAVYYDGPAKPPPATTAPAPATSSRAKARGTCGSAAPAIDAAVAEAFLAALQPAALQACLAAAQQLEDGHDAALAQWRRQVEQARYEAGRAERRYRAVDPDNRLVARGLETGGTPRCKPSPTPRPNSPAAKQHDRKP